MTENNREEILKDIREGYIDVWDNLTIDELFETIKKEHNEIQQYRAIGTVEEFKDLKKQDHDCIIKHLSGECFYKETGCSDCKSKWKIKDLLEKNEPKKPLFSTVHGDSAYHCSSCKKFVGFYDTRIYEYCHNCGQKFDWSE